MKQDIVKKCTYDKTILISEDNTDQAMAEKNWLFVSLIVAVVSSSWCYS